MKVKVFQNTFGVMFALVVLLGFGPVSLASPSAHLGNDADLDESSDLRFELERRVQIELQDGNTSLIQEVDPREDHLRVTVNEGKKYWILSFADDDGSDQGDGQIQEKLTYEDCVQDANLACGPGNVRSVFINRGWLGHGTCCHFECNDDPEF